MHDLQPFFSELHFLDITADVYRPLQIGYTVAVATSPAFNMEEADVIIVGCGQHTNGQPFTAAPDAVRKQLYRLYNWHPAVRLADAGNILEGATPEDTWAALRMVLAEIHAAGKIALVIGGGHELMLQQYEVFKRKETLVNALVVDRLIDLEDTPAISESSFLMDMITGQPNFIRNFSHAGFQSYNVQPRMLETLDKLRFDFFRLGKMREDLDDVEPVFRSADIISFDMGAIRYPDCIANIHGSPNGLTGDEACAVTRLAGSSTSISSMGLYGYLPANDQHDMTASLMAQMIWYFMDGVNIRKTESPLSDRESFVSYHVFFTENDTLFLKSKRTGRWWMQMPDEVLIPCTYRDYLTASSNEIPDRWMREQERLT